MVAIKFAALAAFLQLATAAVIPREEPPHFPSFGLRIDAPNTRFHRSFITLTTSKKAGLKLALIPEDDRKFGIDSEFYIAKDGHLSYGQPGSESGTFVLGFNPEQPKEFGIADAYFMPNTQATSNGVHASAGNKKVVALQGNELKVHGKSKWLVCSINNGKGIVRNLAYDGTMDKAEWKDQESAVDCCTRVKVLKVDLVQMRRVPITLTPK